MKFTTIITLKKKRNQEVEMPAQSVWCVNSVYITRVSTREVRKIYLFFPPNPLVQVLFLLVQNSKFSFSTHRRVKTFHSHDFLLLLLLHPAGPVYLSGKQQKKKKNLPPIHICSTHYTCSICMMYLVPSQIYSIIGAYEYLLQWMQITKNHSYSLLSVVLYFIVLIH